MFKYIFANIKFLLYIFISLFLLLFFFFVGINLWIVLLIFLWLVFYFVVIRKQFIVIKLTEFLISVSFIALIVISTILFVVAISTRKTVINNNMGVKLTKEQCAPLFQEYNGKSLQIMGEDLIGSISIKVNPEDCKSDVRYIFLVKTQLNTNYDTKNNMPYPYNYIASLREPDATTREDNGKGGLSAIYVNKGIIADGFASSSEISEFYREPNGTGTDLTDWFYNSYVSEFYMSHERYQELLKPGVFEIIDGQPFIEVETMDEGGFTTSINHSKAAIEGVIVKSCSFEVSSN